MSRKTSNIPAIERKIILISSDSKLIELVTHKISNPLYLINLFFVSKNMLSFIKRYYLFQRGIKKDVINNMDIDEQLSGLMFVFCGIDMRLPRYDPLDAQKLYKFDFNHIPVDGSIYIQHPLFSERYYLPSNANQRLAEEKLYTFTRLAGALGAKEIFLTDGKVEKTNKKGKLKIPLPEIGAQIGIGGEHFSNTRVKYSLFENFDKPDKEPFVPPEIQPWVDSDPTFRNMVNLRFETNIKTQNILIETYETKGLGIDLAMKFREFNIDTGG